MFIIRRSMTKLVFAVILFLSFSAAASAQVTCGIGTAVKKFNKIDNPIDDDFTVPLKVITNSETMKVPFFYCDADLDLRPGIRFLDVYIDLVMATGRTLQDPAIVYARKMQRDMRAAINKDNDPN
jgi:hypothetical protein